jgi:hypothetical protein
VLRAGDVALRFRGATTTGVDAAGGVAIALGTGWEARGSVDYEGYFYSFNTQYNPTTMSGDLYRARSATDHFYGATIDIAAVF